MFSMVLSILVPVREWCMPGAVCGAALGLGTEELRLVSFWLNPGQDPAALICWQLKVAF